MTDLRNAPWAALLLRLSLGVMFIAHAWLKIFTFTIAGTVMYFESIGYPGLFAYLVMAGELGAGILLILGVYTRWVALLTLPILVGALLEHIGNGWVFSNANGGWEYPAFWIVAVLVQALLGDGALALRPSASPARQPA